MAKYEQLLKQLKNVLKVAKKLGLSVTPNGGYAMSYTLNRLPPYPVGLFGALSIIDGEGARSKLGLSFDETVALETGFNGRPNKKTLKKKKSYPELEAIGMELAKACKGKSKREFAGGLEAGVLMGRSAPRPASGYGTYRRAPMEEEQVFPAIPDLPLAAAMQPTEGLYVAPDNNNTAWYGGTVTLQGGTGGGITTTTSGTYWTVQATIPQFLEVSVAPADVYAHPAPPPDVQPIRRVSTYDWVDAAEDILSGDDEG